MKINCILVLKPKEHGCDFSKDESSILHNIAIEWKFERINIKSDYAEFYFDSNYEVFSTYKDSIILKYLNKLRHDIYCYTCYDENDIANAVAYGLFFEVNEDFFYDDPESKFYNYTEVCHKHNGTRKCDFKICISQADERWSRY